MVNYFAYCEYAMPLFGSRKLFNELSLNFSFITKILKRPKAAPKYSFFYIMCYASLKQNPACSLQILSDLHISLQAVFVEIFLDPECQQVWPDSRFRSLARNPEDYCFQKEDYFQQEGFPRTSVWKREKNLRYECKRKIKKKEWVEESNQRRHSKISQFKSEKKTW